MFFLKNMNYQYIYIWLIDVDYIHASCSVQDSFGQVSERWQDSKSMSSSSGVSGSAAIAHWPSTLRNISQLHSRWRSWTTYMGRETLKHQRVIYIQWKDLLLSYMIFALWHSSQSRIYIKGVRHEMDALETIYTPQRAASQWDKMR